MDQQGNWAAPPAAGPGSQSQRQQAYANNPKVYSRTDSSASNISYGANNPASSRSSFKVSNGNEGNVGIIVANRAGDEETEDGRIRNREAATKIRDAWIYKQIRARQVSLF
jgi:hypothetical protein